MLDLFTDIPLETEQTHSKSSKVVEKRNNSTNYVLKTIVHSSSCYEVWEISESREKSRLDFQLLPSLGGNGFEI